jgi:hypothetical protein
LKSTIHFYMNKDLKNGLLVAGGAIILYLMYKKFSKKDVVVVKKEETQPNPIEVELPIESPVEKPKPIESVLINAPLIF